VVKADTAEELVSRADDEAHASAVAFLLGPDVFLKHLSGRIDKSRQRAEEDYRAIADDRREPDPKADPPGGSGDSGGA